MAKQVSALAVLNVPFLPEFAGRLFTVETVVGTLGSFRMPESGNDHCNATVPLLQECPVAHAPQAFAEIFGGVAELTVHCGQGSITGQVRFFPASPWDFKTYSLPVLKKI